jgi:hypothetical protein
MIPIAEFPTYSIDQQGQIVNKRGHIMKPQLDRHGYYKLQFQIGRTCHHRYVHRLIAIAFLPNPEGKPVINHRNGVKTDNRIENLEWCTQGENLIHKYRALGQTPIHGEAHSGSKLTNAEVIEIRKALTAPTVNLSAIARKHGITPNVITGIRDGKKWKRIA